MSNEILNTLILAVVAAVAVGAGYYVTQKQQPATLEELEAKEEAILLQQAQVEDLIAQEALASGDAAEAYQRWNARYKILPDQLSSPDVVDYLNALSRSGFRSFDITLSGRTQQSGYSVYSYNVSGLAYFESLYAFIWNVENGRGLYRVRDVSIDKEVTMIPLSQPAVRTRTFGAEGVEEEEDTRLEQQVVLTQFSLVIDAYFAGDEAMSAPDSIMAIPAEVFPPQRPQGNPFYPHVLENLPPNVENRVDLQTAELVSVVGQQAVFRHDGELRSLGVGDRVYLGRITSINPNEGRVVGDLNLGGIRERIELDLQSGERYRQALGPTRLQALAGPAATPAPPAPGTPEARRARTYQAAPIPGR